MVGGYKDDDNIVESAQFSMHNLTMWMMIIICVKHQIVQGK